MVIRISSARQIDTLLDDLTTGNAVAREAAVARLIVVGGRAVSRLMTLAEMTGTPATARLAAFRALEGIGDVRALDTALRATSDPDTHVARAAITLARSHLAGPQGIAALDRLTAIALDGSRHDVVRIAALRALGDLEPTTLQPVLDALAQDPSQPVRDAVGHVGGAEPTASPHEEPAGSPAQPPPPPLPDTPEAVRRHVSTAGDTLSLAALHFLIEAIRQREASTEGQQRREWMGARATVHVALARRGSRLGIYDIREALNAAREPLPVEFLAAVTMIGDSSCLEPLAAAYCRLGPADAGADWWHRHLSEAFLAIVTREGITRRHALVRKIDKRWPDRLQEFWPARSPRSLPGRSQ